MNAFTREAGWPEPMFLDGASGPVFALYLPARGELKGALLYLPPFAEEMNRCRAAVAEQARRLNDAGYACLLLDPYGTGDSGGDLVDATWDIWLRDVSLAADWLAGRCGVPITLWGCRLGALLAAHAASAYAGRFARLLFWQPVLDGSQFLTQFLRQRVAWLMDRGLPPETTETMRHALEAGARVEVGGYALSGRLAADLDGKRMLHFSGLNGVRVDWFEHVAEAGRPLSPASLKVMSHLLERACDVRAQAFTGAPIWQLHKRDVVPELIEHTSAVFRGQS